jgi:hypothetical protein
MSTAAPALAPETNHTGAGRFALSASIFLRLLAVVHLTAFGSVWVQWPGLIGPHGIAPAGEYLQAAHAQVGAAAYWALPTLCWWIGTGVALHVLCGVGVVAALVLFVGFAPVGCLAVLWVAFLSLANVGQEFLSFQWDALLLETTLLAIFVAPRGIRTGWRPAEPPRVARWLCTWLLFRLMLLSGVAKLTSGDPTWRSLTALSYHYETQPLPYPLAWWAHQLPLSVHRASCVVMLVIELIVPFFLWAPRPFRHCAALLLAGLQLLIIVTGNFAFFNYLSIALCLLCLDDAWWRRVARWCPRRRATPPGPAATVASTPRPASRWAVRTALAVVAYTTIIALPTFGVRGAWLSVFGPVVSLVAPFESFNTYGLFAVMTTSRIELVIEGSNDGRTWRPYEFRYKPGRLDRRPPVVAPHQPRLDWQMWFAALGGPTDSPWLGALCQHLLRGTPEVLALLADNPFPAAPPRYLRVMRYEYHFTNRVERAQTGDWWKRIPQGEFLPPISRR